VGPKLLARLLVVALLLAVGCDRGGRVATEPDVVEDPGPAAADSSAAVADTTVAPAGPAEPTPAETGLMVDLPPEEQQRLVAETEKHLGYAQEVVTAWEAEPDLPEDFTARLHTVEDYMEMARQALADGDPQGASNLALKARLLAQEMGMP
jgi:hypothetical protein